jgi:hypothetical protein
MRSAWLRCYGRVHRLLASRVERSSRNFATILARIRTSFCVYEELVLTAIRRQTGLPDDQDDE